MITLRVSATSRPKRGDRGGSFYSSTSGSVLASAGSLEIAIEPFGAITGMFPLFVRKPEAGTRRDEIAPGTRGFAVGKYIIYYRDGGKHLIIARVIHGMRDSKNAFLHND